MGIIIKPIWYLLVGVLLLVMTFFIVLLAFIPLRFIKNLGPDIFRIWSKLFVKFLGIKQTIHNENKNELPDQFILISNHPSGVELVWLPNMFDVIPLSKAEIKNWFLIGRIARLAGTVFVNRGDLSSRTNAAMSCLEALENKKNLLIFPEGGCRGKNVNSFLQGAFHISKKSNIPILPVFIYYEDEDSYEWGDYGLLKFIFRAALLPKNRNAHLYIFDALEPNDFDSSEEYHEQIYKFYLETEQKIRSAFQPTLSVNTV